MKKESNFGKNNGARIAAGILFLFGVPALNAAEIWADGVTAESGWTDVDKNWKDDRQLCWAAAASNIIEWWQRKTEPEKVGAPSGEENIFSVFGKTFFDRGLGTNIAWKWYFGGCDLVHHNYERDFRDKDSARVSGRYWEKYVKSAFPKQIPAASDPEWIPGGMISETPATTQTAEKLAGTLKSLFERGYGVSLALVSGGKWPGGHAITLWGMEYEGDAIKALYITDSDDRVKKLQRYEVYYKEFNHRRETDGNGKIRQNAWSETRIYLRSYHGSDNYALSSYGALALPPPMPAR